MAITTDAELQTEVGKLAVGDPTNVPQLTGIVPTVGAGEDIAATSGQLGAGPATTTALATTTGLAPAAPTAPAANVGQIASVDDVSTDLTQLGERRLLH